MHNNFLVDRGGKMSKSTGQFLRLQTLVDAGFHPLAYRMMCLQAHYRSELEFTWENLAAAFTRLKRLVIARDALRARDDGTLKGDAEPYLARLEEAVGDDLGTPRALPVLDELLADKRLSPATRLQALDDFDAVLGLNLATLTRSELRVRPVTAIVTEADIDAQLAARKEARAAKNFTRSDEIRDALAAVGVEVMDGDALAWDWKLAV
jgi:cysteinyl-tRNA synthetase